MGTRDAITPLRVIRVLGEKRASAAFPNSLSSLQSKVRGRMVLLDSIVCPIRVPYREDRELTISIPLYFIVLKGSPRLSKIEVDRGG